MGTNARCLLKQKVTAMNVMLYFLGWVLKSQMFIASLSLKLGTDIIQSLLCRNRFYNLRTL